MQIAILARSLLLLMSMTLTLQAATTPSEIEHLLQYLSESGCEYVRNGSVHSGQEAVAHIRKKYRYYADDIDSTERFIELSASKSTLSGKSYSIRCPGQPEQSSNAWLNAELARYRRAQLVP